MSASPELQAIWKRVDEANAARRDRPIPMTEITPEDLRVKAESVTDPMVVRMLTEAADAIESLRSEVAVWKDRYEASDQAFDATIKNWDESLSEDSRP